MAGQTTQQYIVLPARGLRAPQNRDAEVGMFLRTLNARIGVKASAKQVLPGVDVKVVDSIGEAGAKLIQIRPDALSDLRASSPGVRIVPVRYYNLARAPIPRPLNKPKKLATAVSVRIALKIVSASDGQPVRDALVVAFTDFESRDGLDGTTNAQGIVKFDFGTSSKKLERLYVYPSRGFYSFLKLNPTIVNGNTIKLTPIDLGFTAFPDVLRHFYPPSPLTAGTGITVGVVDTGTGPHPDLNVAGGLNCVEGENPTDFGDNGDMHGTHVGGIIAARGTSPTGVRGVAPGVTLRSYRVFPKGGQATNFAIAKAIDQAINDNCDLINLSLGETGDDPAIHSAIVDARAKGTVVVGASGNEDRSPVDFPANDSLAIAVSAFGRKGTFPPSTADAVEVQKPFGADPKDFIAGFSNIGPEIDLTGPGVGIVSTVPGGFGVMSGTSMACPAVTGLIAKMIAANPAVLSMARDESRWDRIVQDALKAGKTLGFKPEFEGQGRLP
ncbi:MAG TPA: S8 family serine peptidase [Thermoanaerobaculia bacterium]|nr:S8 family serine peptidase [Thermoanaerobaculia bacterium]